MISMQPVLGNITKLMTRHLYNTIESRVSCDQELTLSDCDSNAKKLYFWKENVKILNCKKLFIQPVPSIVSYSDASETGCGSLLSVDNTICHRTWKPHESSKSSTWRELTAIHYGLCSFLPILRNKSVFWFSDNQSLVHIPQFGSQKTYLKTIALNIYSVCLLNGISITLQWAPRSENVDADVVSKLIDYDDWCTADHLFSFLNQLWGPQTIDRFANDQNNELPRFNSLFWTPGREHVNPFFRDWARESNWLVSPVYLIFFHNQTFVNLFSGGHYHCSLLHHFDL